MCSGFRFDDKRDYNADDNDFVALLISTAAIAGIQLLLAMYSESMAQKGSLYLSLPIRNRISINIPHKYHGFKGTNVSRKL